MVEIGVEQAGGVQILRLNRAHKKNALTAEMYAALVDALVEGDRSGSVSAHAILGAPGVFCAGNDIADFLASSNGETGLNENVLRFIRLLPMVAKPIVVGVDGAAIGIGTTLLLHADLVYATPSARFATPFLDLGLVPEAASSLLLPQRIGYARAFEMLVLGEAFSATQALNAGLINALVEPDDLEAKVLNAANRLAGKPQEALMAARKLMRGDIAPVLSKIDEEADAFKQRLASPEAKAAFQAFLNRPRSS